MKKVLFLFTFTLLVVASSSHAQDEHTIKFSGFIDTYYAYDFNKPANHERPLFLYNYTRHNEINLNLGLLKASYEAEDVRANLGLMVGTYGQYNLSAEQGLTQNIYEANVGVKLSEKTWLDAGIMSSHIGWESAISKDNPTLTRSLAAENSPYYLGAVKLSFAVNAQWNAAVLVMNGWQRVKRIDGNSSPALGLQTIYKPSEKLTFNYSNFYGNDRPDSAKAWRFFNDLYAIYQLSEKLNLIAGFDYGIEQKAEGSSSYNNWYTWAFIGQYRLSDKLALAARVEQYIDKKEVIIATGTQHGFQTTGLSLNGDYRINDRTLFRTEIRRLDSRDKIFAKGNTSKKINLAWTNSLSVAF